MTDPVDTDALRAWAVDAQDIAVSGGSGPNMLQLCASNLTAAADEVDRLRKDVAFWIEQSGIWKRLANDERAVTDRLRAAIENAPHDPACHYVDLGDGEIVWRQQCTCWKADAL